MRKSGFKWVWLPKHSLQKAKQQNYLLPILQERASAWNTKKHKGIQRAILYADLSHGERKHLYKRTQIKKTNLVHVHF